jgi:hypothetical protein
VTRRYGPESRGDVWRSPGAGLLERYAEAGCCRRTIGFRPCRPTRMRLLGSPRSAAIAAPQSDNNGAETRGSDRGGAGRVHSGAFFAEAAARHPGRVGRLRCQESAQLGADDERLPDARRREANDLIPTRSRWAGLAGATRLRPRCGGLGLDVCGCQHGPCKSRGVWRRAQCCSP